VRSSVSCTMSYLAVGFRCHGIGLSLALRALPVPRGSARGLARADIKIMRAVALVGFENGGASAWHKHAVARGRRQAQIACAASRANGRRLICCSNANTSSSPSIVEEPSLLPVVVRPNVKPGGRKSRKTRLSFPSATVTLKVISR